MSVVVFIYVGARWAPTPPKYELTVPRLDVDVKAGQPYRLHTWLHLRAINDGVIREFDRLHWEG
jgi:hypothetical protein